MVIDYPVYLTHCDDVPASLGSAGVGTRRFHGFAACLFGVVVVVLSQNIPHRYPDVWEKDYLERIVEMVQNQLIMVDPE